MATDRAGEREFEAGVGFTLLDAVALVIGAAVGSVHLRGAAGAGLMKGGYVLFWLTFAGVALTSAGPFLYLGRRYVRRPSGYPLLGDRLWAILGLPWVLTSPLLTSSRGQGPDGLDLYTTGLVIGIGIASLLTLGNVWKHWVATAPDPAPSEPEHLPWTTRVGMVLSVAWPVQCGFGMVIASP